MIDPLAKDEPESKVNLCCENVFEIWQRTAATAGTQLVFCDLSTPSEDGRFSVYSDLRAKWIARGIPASEIAFIHDHESDSQKASLFKAVRDGKVRILLGSTSKMGVGTNVQTRLFALHHLDCPWRPSDLEQRDGRIERQGNTNAIIEIYRYVSKATFDSYLWQTVENKARFIAQVMSGKIGARAIEDVELAALSFAEVKALASGNPRVLVKAGIDAEVAKLSALKSVWRSNQWEFQSEVRWLPTEIQKIKDRITGMREDESLLEEFKRAPVNGTINGQSHTSHESIGNAMLHCALTNLKSSGKNGFKGIVGNIGKFKLGIIMSQYDDFPSFFVDGKSVEHKARTMKSGNGMVEAILAAIHAIPSRVTDAEMLLVHKERRLALAISAVAIPFEHADRLDELLKQQHEIDLELGLYQDSAGSIDAEEAIAA